jgi:hypothetical protein
MSQYLWSAWLYRVLKSTPGPGLHCGHRHGGLSSDR